MSIKDGTLGFLGSQDGDDKANKEKISKALKGAFRPEFLNRIDEIILFSELSKEEMLQIVELQLKDIQSRLSDHGLQVELTDSAKQWLADVGYDPAFGARPLKRAMQKHIESPLSVSILSGGFGFGDTVVVDIVDDQVDFRKKEGSEE